MYEEQFGLNKRPFRANAIGDDVFVGPLIAEMIAAIKNSLSANDAIVTVCGAVGSGKTTLAMRALASISGDRMIIHIARVQLKSEDVLDFLLDELGVEDKPRGTIQRFATLRRKLNELEKANRRVIVAIEDSVRLGAETLAEVEALTSADGGESDGASLILMGDDNLKALLSEAPLVRVQQRIRKRFTVEALSATELHGYLRHCFRLAGGEFDSVFEANAAEVLHHLSHGIPRICNNLVETAMKAAADQNLKQVSSVLLSQVAESEYGLATGDIDLTPGATLPAGSKTQQASLTALVAALPSEPEISPSPEESADEPVVATTETKTDESHGDRKPLEPVHDTIPNLKVLQPEAAVSTPAPAETDVVIEPPPEPVPVPEPVPEPELELAVAPVPEPVPEPVQEPAPTPVAEPVPEPVLELSLETEAPPQAAAESSGDEVASWERDPTIAELKPDLAALEQAMAVAQGEATKLAAATSEPVPEPLEVMPEITLDNAMNDRIEKAQTGASGPPASDPASTDAPRNQQSDDEMKKMAAEMQKAKSIEDIDDKLAETLFGEELNLIAAQFMANPPPIEAASEGTEAGADKPVVETMPAAQQSAAPSGAAPSKNRKPIDKKNVNLTASQRLRTVMALNSDSQPMGAKPKRKPAPKSSAKPGATAKNHLPNSDAPASFEEQIKTSVSRTQSQRVSKVIPVEGKEKTKAGFFSRFKRS
jgi:type II secretory pathway predicted ATPase ExeA